MNRRLTRRIADGLAALTVSAWRLRPLALGFSLLPLHAASIDGRPPPDMEDERMPRFVDTVATWELHSDAVDQA